MKVGDITPFSGIVLAKSIVLKLLENKGLKIAVLTCMVKTSKALQKVIFGSIKMGHSNITIETVARIQGLTADVTVFVIPNASMNRSLEARLLDVATRRAVRHTFVIADKDIIQYPLMDSRVKKYLEELDNEQSCYIPYHDRTCTDSIEVPNNNRTIES